MCKQNLKHNQSKKIIRDFISDIHPIAISQSNAKLLVLGGASAVWPASITFVTLASAHDATEAPELKKRLQ